MQDVNEFSLIHSFRSLERQLFPNDTVLLGLAETGPAFFFLSLQTTAKMYDPLANLEGSYADSGPWLETIRQWRRLHSWE